MKSTLLNMVAVLFGITLIASAGVGAVYMITVEPITKANADATIVALEQVLPPFDTTTEQELTIDEMPIVVHTASKGDAISGYAVESMTKKGFSGVIRIMVGFTPSGEVVNVNVLEQNETPGLGSKMTEDGNVLITAFKGKNPETMKLVDGKPAVKKDGGDVDAITAATISSRAYVDAMNRAYTAYKSVALGAENTASGSQTVDSSADATAGSARQLERGRENKQERGMDRSDKQGVEAQKGEVDE